MFVLECTSISRKVWHNAIQGFTFTGLNTYTKEFTCIMIYLTHYTMISSLYKITPPKEIVLRVLALMFPTSCYFQHCTVSFLSSIFFSRIQSLIKVPGLIVTFIILHILFMYYSKCSCITSRVLGEKREEKGNLPQWKLGGLWVRPISRSTICLLCHFTWRKLFWKFSGKNYFCINVIFQISCFLWQKDSGKTWEEVLLSYTQCLALQTKGEKTRR